MKYFSGHNTRSLIVALAVTLTLLGAPAAYLYCTNTIARHRADDTSIIPSKAIDWQPFDPEAKEALLEEGKVVIVFVYSSLIRQQGERALNEVDRWLLGAFFVDAEVTAYVIKFDSWQDPHLLAVNEHLPSLKRPVLLIFKPNQTPIPFDPSLLLKRDEER